MKKRWALAVATLALFVAGPARAESPIISLLQEDPVYVEEGSPQTTSDTAGELRSQLNPRDGILVAIVKNGNAPALALDIHDAFPGRIIAVAAGNDVVGYSTILPAGVATDLMKRATTVSTTTPEALGTFIQNVHDWQTQHPTAPAAQPVKDDTSNWHQIGTILTAFLILVGIVTIGFWALRVLFGESGDEPVKFKRSPDSVRQVMKSLLETGDKIEDQSLRATLIQICSDVEAYFQRTKHPAERDINAFHKHLSVLGSVMEKYVDVQDNSRYFEDPDAALNSGKSSAEGLAVWVLAQVRREGQRTLTDFNVDTDILSAQRYG